VRAWLFYAVFAVWNRVRAWLFYAVFAVWNRVRAWLFYAVFAVWNRASSPEAFQAGGVRALLFYPGPSRVRALLFYAAAREIASPEITVAPVRLP
jgi:hypothetical protein